MAVLLDAPARLNALLLHAPLGPGANSSGDAITVCAGQAQLSEVDGIKGVDVGGAHLSEDDQLFYQSFQEALPAASALAVNHAESTCIVQGSSASLHGLTVSTQKGAQQCKSTRPDFVVSDGLLEEGDDWVLQWLEDEDGNDDPQGHTFTAEQELPGGGKERFCAEAWPAEGVCTAGSPCALVVSLHGMGLHSVPHKLNAMEFLNYYNTDAACRKSLRSVLLFPQLMDRGQESFLGTGPQVLELFVVPLVQGFLASNPTVDGQRVAVVGESEGAMGAWMAAALYPDVFTLAVAAGASGYFDHFPTLTPRAKKEAPAKLKAVVMAWAAVQDASQPQMVEALEELASFGILDHAALRGRLYNGPTHMGTVEAVFNNFAALHEVLWLGHFEKIGDLW